MITTKYIEHMVSEQLSPGETEFFMELYATLPFGVRQACAEQLAAEPSLVPLFFTLLQNEEAFAKQYIDVAVFLTNESALVSNFSPA
jgi:hypothetical protein